MVVVPLKTLECSLHARCYQAGISSIMWDAGQVDRMAQVVFVQPESAVGTRFNQFLNRLEGLGQLDRIVIDECHLSITANDYRPCMSQLGWFTRQVRAQTVWLTATLPPVMQEEFI